MFTLTKRPLFLLLVVLALGLAWLPVSAAAPAASVVPQAPISLAAPYSQNFDTLATSGTGITWTDDSTIPGWYSTRTTYNAGNGSSNAGALYSFGTGTSTERALGSVASGSTGTIRYGARFTNDTGGTVTAITVSYTGEQWRNGGNTTQHKLSFDYQVGATVTSLTAGTWTPVTALDFTGPIATSTAGALDGNASANRVAISHTFNVSIPAGHEIMLRWNDPDDSGADHGLAIDDLTVTATVLPTDTPPTVTTTSPANSASGVLVTTNITVNFSEVVDVTASAFTVECPVGTPVAFTPIPSLPADNVTSVTLDPNSNLPYGTTCTVTVAASQVVDNDGTPDPMTQDYVFTFTTEAADPCTLPYTPIYTIQGSGSATPIPGPVTTQGVVVGDYEPQSGSGQIRGFYLQDINGDSDPATSDGIFVFLGDSAVNQVSLGQVVRVAGTAGEFQDQTQISNVTSLIACGTGTVTPVDVTLPFPSSTYLERFEGMLVRLPQTLYVTETFQLGRFGQIVMTSRPDRLPQPTNVVAPGAPALALQAANNLDRIIVDDDNNIQNPDPILFGRNGLPLSASNTLRGGDTATGIVGVLVYSWGGHSASPNAYRVRPVGALGGGVPNFQPANPRPAPPAIGGRLRVTAFNLLNYFNTFGAGNCTLGVGGGATDCRGAESAAEFDRQWPKTVAAILGTGADVIGLMELENDGYGASSAIQDLVNRLNNATSPGTFAFINADALTGQTNALGTDAIKVGLIYKPAKVIPVGQTAVLNTTAFVNGGDSTARNRPALAQAFQEVGTGERFIVVVNHFKSKGSPCDAPDAGDGQGNCNIVRTNAATELVNWLATDPTGTGDPDILIAGDLNSYAMEDPITVIKNAGYVNLIHQWLGLNAYSYVFDGQWGYLDHALATPILADQVTGAVEWHINADEPPVLDYNLNFKSPGQQASLYAPDEFRSSDHDPVVIGLNLAEPNQSNLAGYGLAWHKGNGAVRLGSLWNTGGSTADNDGVAPTIGVPWNNITGGSVDVTVTGADGWVTGWVDWNNDGDFADSGEQVFTNLHVPAGTTVTQTFTIPVPVGSQSFNGRFRVYPSPQTLLAALQPDAPPSPVGGANGGEVEDYTWSFGPNALGLSSFRAAPVAASAPLVAMAAAVALVLAALAAWLARRRQTCVGR
ncbi:MAG: ExeM/NucH family extracellular endonuclease [Caldilineales bacterium]|nr:ExeM/NucH family extracellular endonuclease [Caldilineales bacterium]MDW8319086.1 ExeM/NucH family extracellular endonuclease [Anaerolineae bacterium]